MLVKNGPDAELWQNAWDVLSNAGIASDDIDRVLARKPQANKFPPSKEQHAGAEVFAPVTAPRMHRDILPGSVPLIPKGGATWLQEVASEPEGAVASWAQDLESTHVAATDAMASLLEEHYGKEHHLFTNQNDHSWPSGLPEAEQFYSLRDTVNYVEQWLPGDCLQHPGLIGIIGVAVAIDECVIFSKDIPDTRFLGITVSQWESLVLSEVEKKGGDNVWLDVGFASLHGCICLQNLEKAMLGGSKTVKTASMDWHDLKGYFTRCEIALTSTVSFFVAAYSGVPYREQYVRPLSVASATNGVVFDLAKRATGRGGGSVTEVDLGGEGGVEIRMRAHLINRLLSYACEKLPASLTLACYRFWESTSVMPLLNDRYVERVSRRRAAVPQAYLKKMDDILRLTGGSLRIPTHRGSEKPSDQEFLRTNGHSELAGWQPSIECCGQGLPTQNGGAGKVPVPSTWLLALTAGHNIGSASAEGTSAPSVSTEISDGTGFKSLLNLVPTVRTGGAQDLESVFDGGTYVGRPVGSSYSATA